MNKMLLILKKELREIFRDKKSLSMMLIIPLIIPVLVIGFSAYFNSQIHKDANEYNKIGFGYTLSEEEKQIVENLDIEATYDNKENLEEKLDNNSIYLYITKDNNTYTLNYSSSSMSGSNAASIAYNYLETYKKYLQNNYLINNNIEPTSVLDIINITENDTGNDNYYAKYIVTYAFTFILMAITISAIYPATDSTAGEKERGTLETLLTFPITSKDIILGKLASTTISSIVTGLFSLILAIISFKISNGAFSVYENIPISFGLSSIIISIVIIIIFSLFISGLCISITALSKSFKEAQSAVTPVTFIAMFPGLIADMIGITTTPLLSIIPFINFPLIFSDVSRGTVNYLEIFLMIISTIIYTVIIISYIIKQYKSEKVLFAR